MILKFLFYYYLKMVKIKIKGKIFQTLNHFSSLTFESKLKQNYNPSARPRRVYGSKFAYADAVSITKRAADIYARPLIGHRIVRSIARMLHALLMLRRILILKSVLLIDLEVFTLSLWVLLYVGH